MHHSSRLFDTLDHLWGTAHCSHMQEKFGSAEDIVVVSPDVGSVSRSRKFAENLMHPWRLLIRGDLKQCL